MFLVQTNSRSSILVKEFVYVGGAALALLAASAGVILDGRIASGRISRNLAVSFALLIAWMVFRHYTGVQSVNAFRYIYGTIALAGLVFVIAAAFTEKARDSVLWVMVVSTVVLSTYAILQSFGMIIFPWDAGLAQMARSSGTMGNANLLGSFSMAMLPAGTGFLLSRMKLGRFRHLAAAGFALLCAGAIIASKTRGSLIGLIAIAVILPFIPSIRKNGRRLLPLLLAILILIGGSVLLLGNRMEELADTETGTLQVRKLIWSGSISMVLENPILGYGPGSFQIVFPEFRSPDYFLLGVSHNTLHAHCEYMEILGDTGIIGLLLWAAAALSLFSIVYRNRTDIFRQINIHENSTSSWLTIGITGGIAALLAEALVSVALRWPPSSLLLALFTGLLLASIPCRLTVLKGVRRYSLALVLLLTGIILGAVAVPGYLRAMKSGRELFRGKDMYLTHIMSGVETAIIAADEWRSSGNEEAGDRALYYYHNAMEVADSSVTWCERSVRTNPDELGGWYALGSAYVSTARLHQQISPSLSALLNSRGLQMENPLEADRYLHLGLAAFDSLLSRAPYYAEIHNNLALVWINLGNPERALASLRSAWDLHTHNRMGYTVKVRILTPISQSLDGVYLRWQMSMRGCRKLLDTDELETENIEFRSLMFDYGATFLRYPDTADSLKLQLDEIITNHYPDVAPLMREYTDLQISRLRDGLELLGRFEVGDTAGVYMNLSSIPQNELDVLPLHRTIYAKILMSRGNIEGMQIFSEILGFLSGADIEGVSSWPMEVSEMIEDLSNALLITGLDAPDEQQVYLSSQINMLSFDRKIFELILFVESSIVLQESVSEPMEKLEILWEQIGGPLYCYMNLRDEQGGPPAMRESSLLEESYYGILELEAQDSLSAELIEFEIQWLYILFCSSYNSIPHYSTVQGAKIVSLLINARGRLVELIGENEAQYRIGRILNDLSDLTTSRVSGEFTLYIEALKTDLILGRIIPPDLP